MGSFNQVDWGMIMTHSDDDGLIVPPKVAPTQIVILPLLPKKKVAPSS
jgi:prolyl-tRNA synthetase